MKITVMHSFYGCDTGCCGHIVYVDDEQHGQFQFDHPDSKESYREFAENLIKEKFGEEHIKDLDWKNSVIQDE